MENHSFDCTYCAAQQQEVENIRKKYLPKEENKMERLRKLDRGATQKAQTHALSLGVIGTLILGTGMSLFMSDLGTMLSLSENAAMLIGIAAGLIGMVLVALAYPVYNRVLKKERARLAPEILRLTDELMK
jgi:hypothetical protein